MDYFQSIYLCLFVCIFIVIFYSIIIILFDIFFIIVLLFFWFLFACGPLNSPPTPRYKVWSQWERTILADPVHWAMYALSSLYRLRWFDLMASFVMFVPTAKTVMEPPTLWWQDTATKYGYTLLVVLCYVLFEGINTKIAYFF